MLCKIVLPSNEIFKLPSLPKTYDELFTAVKIRLDEPSSNTDFILKYMDSDSELVNLHTDEDLHTAVLTNQIDQVKTLRVIVVFKESSGCGSIPIADKNTVRTRQSGPLKLVEALEKANIDLTQSQAFDKLKNVSMESSKAVKGASQFRLTEDQMEAIRGFIGARVKQVMDENMKDMIPGLVARFQDKRKNMEIVNRSQVSENGAERTISPTKMSYFTPTTRKANWFGDYCADCMCNECSQNIQEIKYVCLECSNYKCCQQCENKVEHAHPLLKVRASLAAQTSSQIMKMSMLSKSYAHISPEDYRKRGKNNYISGQSLIKKTGEKKLAYCGKVFLEDAEGQIIKARPSQEHIVTVVVEIIGSEAWPSDVRLCCVNGTYRNRQEDLIPLNPGTKQVLHLNIEAPSQTGRHLSQWKLCCNNDDKVRSFGESLFIEMQVEEKKLLYSKSSEENVPEARSSNTKRTTLSLRRGNTFSESDSYMIEEKRKAEKADFGDQQSSIAKYLNEIFPGCIEEKHRFLRDCERHVDIKDMTKIIELYMRKLSRSKCDKTSSKKSDDNANPEFLYTLS